MRKHGMTLDEIGKAFGVSRERVRQIIGTQYKSARTEAGIKRANDYLSKNTNVTWDELQSVAGISAETMMRFGLKKPSAKLGPEEKWTKERVVEAGREWKKRTGKFPTQHDWQYADSTHPMFMTVYRKFGSWSEFRRAAGETILDGRKRNSE